MSKEIIKEEQKITKEDRFKKVAARRVQEILHKMRLLKNCANKNNYGYTEEQVNKIISVVDSEWKIVKAEFRNQKSNDEAFNL